MTRILVTTSRRRGLVQEVPGNQLTKLCYQLEAAGYRVSERSKGTVTMVGTFGRRAVVTVIGG